jgi:hypothetical protein
MTVTISSRPDAPLANVSGARSVAHWLIQRRYGVGGMTLVLVTGMAFSLLWWPLQGRTGWFVPGDIWATYRGAHFVGWGDLGGVYASNTGLVTFPGITVLLAPVAMLTGSLGLSESFPFPLPHPTAWLFLGPVELLLGASLLVALDALAEQVGATPRRRLVLSLVAMVVVWPLVAIWGHPEDGLAMTCALSAVVQFSRGNLRACGWCFGAALAFQPLVILVAPVLVAVLPSARQRVLFLVRSALPPITLVIPGLAQYWHATVHSLLEQPNYPTLNHPTPLLALSPLLRSGRAVRTFVTHLTYKAGRYHLVKSLTSVRPVEVVAAGPGRMVALALCCGVGILIWRRRASISLPMLAWLLALCLTLRCLLESVMDPFYFVPPLVMIVFCGALGDGRRFAVAGVVAVAVTVFSEYHLGPWAWYLPLTTFMVAGLLVTLPRVPRSSGATTYGFPLALGTRGRGLG